MHIIRIPDFDLERVCGGNTKLGGGRGVSVDMEQVEFEIERKLLRNTTINE